MSFKQFLIIVVVIIALLLIGATASADIVKSVVEWIKAFLTELFK